MVTFSETSASSGGRQADITLPATISAGDLLVAMHYDINDEAIPATPSGWTLINSITSGSTSGTLGIIAKIAVGNEDGTNLSWFSGTDNNYAAFSLTPSVPISSLESVTGTAQESNSGSTSQTAQPSLATYPAFVIYAGGSNGAVNVAPDGDFSERFTGTDGIELNATFYDVGDGTTDFGVTTGDTGRQSLVLGNLNLNFSVSISASVTGVAGTSAIGAVTVSVNVVASLTGVSATGQLNTVTISNDSSISLTGVSGTTAITAPAISADANTTLAGVAGTSALNPVTVSAKANATLVGIVGTSALNTVTISAKANVSLTGSSATATLGNAIGTGNTIFFTAPSLLATTQINNVSITAVIFNFETNRDNYSRNRTVYLKAHNVARTVYVEEEQHRTVYVESQNNNRKAYVAA
tara:strand:+ start:4743 stop:5975 length:1233 start_codon:yes stop_codon:yes gene_type:complete